MTLVDAEQFDQQQHGIVGGQFVLFAPFGDRLREFLVVIGRLFCALAWASWLRWQQKVGSRFDFGVKFLLPGLQSLPVQQAEGGMFHRRRDGQVFAR